MKHISVIGKKFGRLLAIKLIDVVIYNSKEKKIKYECLCDCGNTTFVLYACLVKGSTKSCGCLKVELMKSKATLEPWESTRNYVMSSYVKSAKASQREFSLTKELFTVLISANCHYCGIKPSMVTNKYLNKMGNLRDSSSRMSVARAISADLAYNGIDRIDNDVGYITENCVTCCWACNKKKSNLSSTEWTNWIKRITKFRNEV